jgi:hypothetical protein
MRKRRLMWVGAGITLAAMAGLGVYFARVGLDDAGKISGVIGVFVALAGLGVAVYGTIGDRPSRASKPTVSASGSRSVAIGGDNTGIVSTGDAATTAHPRAEAPERGPGGEP